MNALELHIENLFVTLSIPEAGRKLVRTALIESPVRTVQGRRGNCLTRFPSKKMPQRMMLESRRGELPQAKLLEDDDDVLGWFVQPLRADLTLKNADGSIGGRQAYCPDFLVIRTASIEIVETRDEAKLIADSIRSHQFFKDGDGNWHYKAAEEFFSERGLQYRLLSNIAIPVPLVLNMRFLEDYAQETCPPVDPEIREGLISLLQERRCVPLLTLIHECNFTADAIYQSILAQDIYVDVYTERLDVTSELVVFSDKATSDAYRIALRASKEPVLPIPGTTHIASGTIIKFDGKPFVVVICGEREVVLQDEDGYTRAVPLEVLIQINKISGLTSDSVQRKSSNAERLAGYNPHELQRALKRLNAIKNGDSTEISSRSLSRYRSSIKNCQDEFSALVSLIDNTKDRGNHEKRLPLIVEELAVKAIQLRYNQPQKCIKKAAFGLHVKLCDEQSQIDGIEIRPMSYVTFCKRCDEFNDTRAREGKRKAYQQDAIPQILDHSLPVHGVRPHEVCYIDHTIATMATISPDGVDLGKPTFSLAIDGNSTHARAFILSYDPPSARIALLLLRDYARRNNRLPKVIVVDNAKEFHSKELDLFCGIYAIEIRYRQSGMPRSGAMIERALGATEEEVFAQLQGNTRQMRDPRLVTKSVNPFGLAAWTLTALWGALEEFLFSIKPDREHPTLGMTPNQYEAKRIVESGLREHTLIRFDETLMLLTSPHARKPFHKVDKTRGVWVDGLYYWNSRMRSVRRNEKVEVRVEPWMHNIIYLEIDKKWIVAIARNQRPFAGKTRRSVEVAIREERRRAALNANKATVSKSQLKKKERLWSPETFDPRVDAQQHEMTYLYDKLGMTVAIPPEQDVDILTENSSTTSKISDPSAPTSNPVTTTDSRKENSTASEAGDEHSHSSLLDNVHGLF